MPLIHEIMFHWTISLFASKENNDKSMACSRSENSKRENTHDILKQSEISSKAVIFQCFSKSYLPEHCKMAHRSRL